MSRSVKQDYDKVRTKQADKNETICGETIDHEQRITYEDADTQTWACTRCGAEWWHDKDEES